MTHAVIAASFAREPFYYIEIQIGSTVYRYCTARDLVPVGLDAIPCLKGVPSISPAEADSSGGPGLRASITVALSDFADQTAGGVNYWAKWRAVNPYYEGRRLSYFAGFVEGDTFDASNFIRRDYVIEKFDQSRAGVTFTGKDPLKLAANNKAQYPAASKGTLLAALTNSATSATLQPSGVGSEYPASGFVRVRSEVMAFTRSGDALTLTRAQYNTAATAHNAGDTVQLCAVINASAPAIVQTLLTAAGVSASYIPIAEWNAEASIYLPGNYATILTEPVGVTTLLKEIGEQAPHMLYWDDRANVIQFVAIKAPPSSGARELNASDHIINGSFDLKDDPDQRVTRVFVYFGQFDPTKKLDEASNYRQTFIRVDPTAETNYQGSKIKTVFSRWISDTNKAAAIRLAARIGRRFYNTPRRASLSVDVKDSDVWTGSPVKITHPMIADTSGAPKATDFQVISAADRGTQIALTALEWLYGPAVPEDADADATGKLVVISGEMYGLNLRTIFNAIYPSVDAADNVRFVFDGAAVIGSTSTATPAIDTGAWPELTTPPLLDVRGFIAGAGGKGEDSTGGGAGAGGIAIKLSSNVRINNSGTIGGGGGGGGRELVSSTRAAGGGGAGFNPGQPGSQTTSGPSSYVVAYAAAGTRTTGGQGAQVVTEGAEPETATGGYGGDLGQPGQTKTGAGGAAGLAIQRNGFTITYEGAGAGDIRGAIT